MLIFYRSCFLLAVGLAPAALAQQSARPAPADPAAPVPAVEYKSAFMQYAPFRDEGIADWRALNDEVARAGGHIGIMGGAGHGGHSASKPAATSSAEGQPPMRGAPEAPAGEKHQQH